MLTANGKATGVSVIAVPAALSATVAGIIDESAVLTSRTFSGVTVAGSSTSFAVMVRTGRVDWLTALCAGLKAVICGGVWSAVRRLIASGAELSPAASSARMVTVNAAPVTGATPGKVNVSVRGSFVAAGSTRISAVPVTAPLAARV